MATIRRFGLPIRQFQSEPNNHILKFRRGVLKTSGRGVGFWFSPYWTSIAEIPCDDRDLPFLFHGRSSDFQDITVQGTLSYRIEAPESIAERIDFTVDLDHGRYLKTPLEQISELLSQLVHQVVNDYLIQYSLRELLAAGVERIRARILADMARDENLNDLGLKIISARIAGITPTSELEKALQAVTREAIQEESDEALFRRRALAVDKERAIAENELQNRIELSRQEQQLIEQEGQNSRQKQAEIAEAEKIKYQARADRRTVESQSEANAIGVVQAAKNQAEREQMETYRATPATVLVALAAREFAANLNHIEHLSLGEASLTPLLSTLVQSTIKNLESPQPETGNDDSPDDEASF